MGAVITKGSTPLKLGRHFTLYSVGIGLAGAWTATTVPAHAEIAAPTISSFAPVSAAAGGPGFTLTVAGTNFITTSKVYFGTKLVPTTFASSTKLTAAIPADAIAVAGNVTFAVTNGDGLGHSELKTFVVTPAIQAPTLTSIDPGTCVAGHGAFTLTLTGTNFITTSKVYFGTGLVPTTYVSPTKLTASIPASAVAVAGNPSVVVTNGDGKGHSEPKTFVVTAAVQGPTLTSIDPGTRVAGSPGFTMTLIGTNFISSSRVYFGTGFVPTTFISSTKLTAAIPASAIAAAGNLPVVVTNGEGLGHSEPKTFVVTSAIVAPPTIGALLPAVVPAGSPGFTMTVNGTGFIAASKVIFGTTLLATTYVSPTQLMATVPAAAVATAGHFPVVVNNGDGKGHSAPADFTVSAVVVVASPRVTYYVNTVPGADGIGVSYPVTSETALDLTLPVKVSVVIPASTEPGGTTAAVTVYQSPAVTLSPRTMLVNGVPVTTYVFENTMLRVGVLPHDKTQYSVEMAAKGLDLSKIDRTRPVVVTLTLGGKTFTGKAVPATRAY